MSIDLADDECSLQPLGYASLRIFLIDSLFNFFLFAVNVLITLVVYLGSIVFTARPMTMMLLRTSGVCQLKLVIAGGVRLTFFDRWDIFFLLDLLFLLGIHHLGIGALLCVLLCYFCHDECMAI